MPNINSKIPSRSYRTDLTNNSGVIDPYYSSEVMSGYRQQSLPKNAFGKRKRSEIFYLKSFLK